MAATSAGPASSQLGDVGFSGRMRPERARASTVGCSESDCMLPVSATPRWLTFCWRSCRCSLADAGLLKEALGSGITAVRAFTDNGTLSLCVQAL